ncbi:hypothetical protein ACFOGG_05230 [Brenneria rubrifaciens]
MRITLVSDKPFSKRHHRHSLLFQYQRRSLDLTQIVVKWPDELKR